MLIKNFKLLVVIILCSLSGSILAQDESFGLKGGLNVSTIGGDAEGVSSKIGFHVGLFTRLSISKKMNVQPEFIYSAQGASITGTDTKLNYKYFNIPFIFKLYPEGDRFHFNFGPQIGVLLDAEASDGFAGLDVKRDLNHIDLALSLGLGYDFDKTLIDLRYNVGLNSSSADTSDGTFPLRTFQISIGTMF